MRNLVITKNNSGLDYTALYFSLLKLIILTAPLIIYGFSIYGMSLRISRILMILIVPLFCLRIKSNFNIVLRDKFFLYGIFPFLVFSALSLFWTPASSLSFGLNRLAALCEVMLIYLLIIVADLNVEKFQSLIKTYFASAVIPAFIGAWQGINNLIHFSIIEVPFDGLLIQGKYEFLKNRYIFSENGMTRLTSSFAEPTIFGTFAGSVLLLSLLIEVKSIKSKIVFRSFQAILLYCLIFSLSKLAILTFVAGLIIIYRKNTKRMIVFGIGGIAIATVTFIVLGQFFYMGFFIKRFLTTTGHLNLLLTSVTQIMNIEGINILIGNGLGSVPKFSTNKFLLSRIYEGGVFGFLFAMYVTLVPFLILFQKVKNSKISNINNISFGVISSIIIGFNLYDNFIYIWPWTVIGMIMSFYWNTKFDDEVLA